MGRIEVLKQVRKKKQVADALPRLQAVIHPAEEGGFWAEVPALRGCYTEGETLEETIRNLQESIAGWLRCTAKQNPPADDPKAVVVEFPL